MKKYILLIVASLFFTFTGLRWAYAQGVEEKEMNESNISVRKQGKGDAGVMDLTTFIEELTERIKSRKEE